MQTQITARHFHAPSELQQHIKERLAWLERYYDGITDAHVVLTNGQVGDRQAEIILNVYRQQLTARETATTHAEAVDRCTEQLRRQLLRYKEKLRGTNRHHRRRA
ncbi:ribosome-associated translation inhibitor RaiA [Rhodocaloribacter litoris]|uniref:ribosome hibernation-promoting factor, HPF/YfiA family n=1 Tax=Rhodocaloribacter litoris TaxID=2558931 RepID=UPI00141F867C|nr:ribosome-associated translation inhibitor RaiA [Rhodocaloribacter litoris]QXD14388.1 ribosome-associated translation inhibitor RaiA [Rhodocaloribacter litoris]